MIYEATSEDNKNTAAERAIGEGCHKFLYQGELYSVEYTFELIGRIATDQEKVVQSELATEKVAFRQSWEKARDAVLKMYPNAECRLHLTYGYPFYSVFTESTMIGDGGMTSEVRAWEGASRVCGESFPYSEVHESDEERKRKYDIQEVNKAATKLEQSSGC